MEANNFKNIIEQSTGIQIRSITDEPKQRIFSMNFADIPVPKYVESKSAEYILNGKNHEYCRFLLDLQNKSSIHKSITTSKAQMIAGEGVKIDTINSTITEQQANSLNAWFNNINRNGESIDDVLKKCAKDYAILSYAAIQVLWSDDEQSIAELMHVDASMVAFGKNNSITNLPEFYKVSNDWSNLRKKENEPKTYPAFNPNNRTNEPQILIIKDYDTGSVYFSQPDYSASANYILIDNLISEYHKANLENNMQCSMHINFSNGEPAEEEKEKLFEDIKTVYGGAKNTGKILVTFSNDKEHAPSYQMMNVTDADKQFIMLNNSVAASILQAHRAKSVLFLETPGSLGQTTELMNATDLFTNQVIYPIQILFEKAFEKLISFNGFEGVRLTIADSQPISFQVADLGNYLTKDEVRQKLGYAPIQQTDIDKKPLLIEVLGVGGTQGLLQLLQSPIQPEQKINALVIVFGLTEDEAKKIVGTTPAIQPTTNTTNENDSQ